MVEFGRIVLGFDEIAVPYGRIECLIFGNGSISDMNRLLKLAVFGGLCRVCSLIQVATWRPCGDHKLMSTTRPDKRDFGVISAVWRFVVLFGVFL